MEEIWGDSREVGFGDEGSVGVGLDDVGGKRRTSSYSRAERVGGNCGQGC